MSASHARGADRVAPTAWRPTGTPPGTGGAGLKIGAAPRTSLDTRFRVQGGNPEVASARGGSGGAEPPRLARRATRLDTSEKNPRSGGPTPQKSHRPSAQSSARRVQP